MSRPDKKIKLFGEVLQDGVWIYVADVKRYRERLFLYVGKTGKKCTKGGRGPTPTSPWARLAAHLDDAAIPFNCLKHHLKTNCNSIDIRKCFFELSCFGPKLVDNASSVSEEHEIVQEVEAQLADRIRTAKYPLIGTHIHAARRRDQATPIVDSIVNELKKGYLTALK
jgi:hypothetical protein